MPWGKVIRKGNNIKTWCTAQVKGKTEYKESPGSTWASLTQHPAKNLLIISGAESHFCPKWEQEKHSDLRRLTVAWSTGPESEFDNLIVSIVHTCLFVFILKSILLTIHSITNMRSYYMKHSIYYISRVS